MLKDFRSTEGRISAMPKKSNETIVNRSEARDHEASVVSRTRGAELKR